MTKHNSPPPPSTFVLTKWFVPDIVALTPDMKRALDNILHTKLSTTVSFLDSPVDALIESIWSLLFDLNQVTMRQAIHDREKVNDIVSVINDHGCFLHLKRTPPKGRYWEVRIETPPDVDDVVVSGSNKNETICRGFIIFFQRYLHKHCHYIIPVMIDGYGGTNTMDLSSMRFTP